MIGSVIVAGSDGIAVRLVEELVALGEAVAVLAREMEPRFRTHLEREGVRVLQGDPRDVADLKLAGLDSAAGLAIVEDSDVDNLHAALAARGARPDIRLVVRMFNQQLGSRLEALFPDAHILSASAIAAPAFLAAALRRSQRVVVADRAFDVRASPRMTTWRASCRSPRSTRTRALQSCARLRLPGVLALIPDQPDETAHGGRSCGRGRGWRATTGRLARASLLTRAAAVARLFDRRLLALLTFVSIVLAVGAVIWSAGPTTACSTAPTSRSRPSPPPAMATSPR